MKACPSCQTECEDSAKFCNDCGAKFEPPARPPEPIPAVSPQQAQAVFDVHVPAPEEARDTYPAPQPAETQPAAETPAAPPAAVQPPPVSTPYHTGYPPYYAPAKPQAPYYAPVYPYAALPKPLQPTGPVVETVREAGGSALVLAAAILMALSVITMILSSVFISSGVYTSETIRDIYGYSQYSATEIDMIAATSRVVSISMFSITQISPALICVGLLMFFFSCRSKRSIKTGGLKLIRVMVIISLCGLGLAALFLLFAMIAAVAGAGETVGQTNAGAVYGVLVIYFAVLLLILAAMVLYYVKIILSISKVTYTIRSGEPNGKISLYVIVVNFVNAIFSLLAVAFAPFLSTLIANFPDEEGLDIVKPFFAMENIWPLLASSLLTSAMLVIISIAMLRYRGKMSEFSLA